jgi:hypothetical protein
VCGVASWIVSKNKPYRSSKEKERGDHRFTEQLFTVGLLLQHENQACQWMWQEDYRTDSTLALFGGRSSYINPKCHQLPKTLVQKKTRLQPTPTGPGRCPTMPTCNVSFSQVGKAGNSPVMTSSQHTQYFLLLGKWIITV